MQIDGELKTEADLKSKFPESIAQNQIDFKFLQFSRPSLFALLPVSSWLPIYVKGGWREGLQKDIFAGLVMGIMLIPQGMAYSMTALLPPEYGFYTSITPSLVYMLLGTCGHLQVSPDFVFYGAIELSVCTGWSECTYQYHGGTGAAVCTARHCA